MRSELDLSCTVSGSFSKFKPEIDRTIEEFRDLGVNVLAPEPGWLHRSPLRQYHGNLDSFRPLPTEVHMQIREIEDDFLEKTLRSNFLYVVNPLGFIGETVGFEVGFALASEIPVYSQKQISSQDDYIVALLDVFNAIKVFTPAQVVAIEKENLASNLL